MKKRLFPFIVYIIWMNIKWSWRSKQWPHWLWKALLDREKYKTWWQHEIVRAYREYSTNRTAFSKDIDGLPGIWDRPLKFPAEKGKWKRLWNRLLRKNMV